MPPDIPKCGFDGNLCDYTPFIVAAAILGFLAITAPLGYFLYKKE